MKKLAVISITLLLVMAIGQVQATTAIDVTKKDKKNERKELRKLDLSYVNSLTMANFKNDIGKGAVSEVKWKKVLDFTKADFIKDGQKREVYYDEDGLLVGSSSYVSFTDLPQRAQNYIEKRYGDYAIEQIIDFINNLGDRSPLILCGYELTDKDNYFIQLTNGEKKLILYVDMKGNVSYFKHL